MAHLWENNDKTLGPGNGPGNELEEMVMDECFIIPVAVTKATESDVMDVVVDMRGWRLP